MSTECVDAFIKRVPKSLLRLNIAGCRKSLSDNRKYLSSNTLREDDKNEIFTKIFVFFSYLHQILQIWQPDVRTSLNWIYRIV